MHMLDTAPLQARDYLKQDRAQSRGFSTPVYRLPSRESPAWA